MKQWLKNVSGADLRVGAGVIKDGEYFLVASVDAKEWVAEGLAAFASAEEAARYANAAATTAVRNAAAAAKVGQVAQPAAAKAAAANDKK